MVYLNGLWVKSTNNWSCSYSKRMFHSWELRAEDSTQDQIYYGLPKQTFSQESDRAQSSTSLLGLAELALVGF